MKAETFIDFYRNWIKTVPDGHPCEIIWHGGEPTLIGREFFVEVLRECREITPPEKEVSHCLQTNAVSIDQAWADLFLEHNVLVGVSMDGPKWLHDKQRIREKGQGTFDQAIRGYKILETSGLDVGIVVVVNKSNVNLPREIFAFMQEFGIKRIQLSPCLELVEDKDPYSITPEAYSVFIKQLFETWVASGDPDVSIGVISDFIDHLHSNAHYNCMLSDRCHNFAVLDHTGHVKTCDGMGTRQVDFGDIGLDPANSSFKEAWKKHHDDISTTRTENCSTCEWVDICHGGCPYHWPDDGVAKTAFCSAHKDMFSYMANRLTELQH